VGRPLFPPLHKAHSDDSIPSSVQRPRGAVPPPTEGYPPSQSGRSGLVHTPPFPLPSSLSHHVTSLLSLFSPYIFSPPPLCLTSFLPTLFLLPQLSVPSSLPILSFLAYSLHPPFLFSSYYYISYPTPYLSLSLPLFLPSLFSQYLSYPYNLLFLFSFPISPLPTSHHNTPAPTSLPEDLLLSCFVLVHHDGVQPPLSPLYDGPFLVVERSLHFFKLQMGTKVETVSTHRLKPCHAPQDAQAAEPPRRGRPPNKVKPSVVRQPPLSVSRQQSCRSSKDPAPKRRVSFAVPVATSGPPPPQHLPPAPPDIKLGRPVRSTARPTRYTA